MRIILTLSTLLLICTVAFCEPRLGRLEDGRAYRVDDAGIEMVDHLAELELTVEELKTRMHGLEYELEEKTNIINALKSNGAQEPAFTEVDLLNGQPQAPDGVVADHTSQLKQTNENLSRQLTDKEPLLLELQNQISSCTANLHTCNSGAGSVNAAKTDNDQNMEAQFESLRTSLFKEQENAARADAALQNLTRDFELLKDQRDQLASDLRATKLEQAQSAPLATNANELPAPEARAALRSDKLPGVADARSELNTNLNRVRGMKVERDRRYRLYRMGLDSHQKVVKMSELRTKRGMNLNSLAVRIEQLDTKSESRLIASELNELREIIAKDMALLGRL